MDKRLSREAWAGKKREARDRDTDVIGAVLQGNDIDRAGAAGGPVLEGVEHSLGAGGRLVAGELAEGAAAGTEQQDQVKNIQVNQLQTELKYLRSQLNPHFLFNGLNTVYGYIDINNGQARDMMVQFSDLLRYNLYEADVEMIELEKEIKVCFVVKSTTYNRAR